MPADHPLLELREVQVHYGQFEALRKISYEVMAGQIVCLLGGNASGKSTSMKAIFGAVKLSSGEILWDGERIDRKSTQARVRAGIAAVPEGRRMFGHMSVEENLIVGASAWAQRSHELRVDLQDVFERFPRLAEIRRRPAGALSGGEQQMVAFGRALMARPRLICMDEPSMGLSPKMTIQTMRLIESLREAGTSVFVVEQNANAALPIADYAYVLRQGVVAIHGPAAEIAESPEMREAYLV